MRIKALCTALLTILLWSGAAFGFQFIKSRADYLEEIPTATELDYRVALIRNFIDFVSHGNGLFFTDWLEARGKALGCAESGRYGRPWDVPDTVPGYAGDSSGSEILPWNFRFRNRLYDTNWTFTGYSHCGGTVNFQYFFFLRSVTNPEKIGLRWLSIEARGGRRIFGLSYLRRDEIAPGAFSTIGRTVGGPYWRLSTPSTTRSPTVEQFETFLSGTARQLERYIREQDGIDITFDFSDWLTAGIHIAPNNRILNAEWMKQVIRRLNLGRGSHRFSGGLPVMGRIGYVVTTVYRGPPRLNVGVSINGHFDRGRTTTHDYYVTRTDPETYTIYNSSDEVVGTATDVDGIVQVLSGRL